LILPTAADCSPIVLCEAAAFGLPCLAHDVGGIASIVQSGKTGQLFNLTSEPEVWAQWLHKTFADPEIYSQLAIGALEDAHIRLNWESFCKEFVEFLRS
jgi:glycosyltransferase involved in cell wall biosynthesis